MAGLEVEVGATVVVLVEVVDVVDFVPGVGEAVEVDLATGATVRVVDPGISVATAAPTPAVPMSATRATDAVMTRMRRTT